MNRSALRRSASLVAALLVLDFALTFAQVWPTFAIRPTTAVSVEILVLIGAVLALGARGRLRPRTLTALAIALTAMVVGRYAAVMTAGLYGRPVHLYFDLPHVPNVFAMLAKVASPWLLAGGALLAAAIIACVLVAARTALGRIADAASRPGERRAVAALCVAAGVLGLVGSALPIGVRFAEPVTGVAAVQVGRFVEAAVAARRDALLPPPARFGDGPLGRLDGRDVLIVFVESYGAVTFDRADVRDALAASRARLERAIAKTGRDAVSAFVESPTFAGASWLAHASFMVGGRIDNGGAYARLLAETRDTLPKRFARAGYRTVAVMPGLRDAWPEGAFFGFDALYDAERLDYRGPEFGWWRIPDQYALAQLERSERTGPARDPLFAFFATLSTHVPFRPTPPYEADWTRVLDGAEPFERAAVERSLGHRPDWLDLAPAYVDSVRYALEMLAGYLEWRANDDFVLVILGDHQPAASITGTGARWAVPVHVVAPRGFTEPLAASGFVPGLVPRDAVAGEMHELATKLLDAFDEPSLRRRELDIAEHRDGR